MEIENLAIIQARMNSSRLFGKVLKTISSKSLLEIMLERLSKSKKIDKIVVATTVNNADDLICELCDKLDVDFFRGSEENVLLRYFECANEINPNTVVRLTSDCPLLDSSLVDEVIDHFYHSNTDYTSNTLNPTFPDGQDVEVMKFSALKIAYKEAVLKSELEHVTPFIWKNSTYFGRSLFSSSSFENEVNYSSIRMTVDEIEDFKLIENLIHKKGIQKTWKSYIEAIEKDGLSKINEQFKRNEGYNKSLKND